MDVQTVVCCRQLWGHTAVF